MRKIIVIEFLTLDGIMQAPNKPEEDSSGDFKFGGWTAPFSDEYVGNAMGEQMKQPFALLLGRKTFDIFAAYWPQHSDWWPGVNDAIKYVVSNSLKKSEWENTKIISGDAVQELKKLKAEDGPDLKVWGSGNLCQTLFKNELVDELWLKIFPVTLGKGKRLFGEGAVPAAYKLMESKVSPSGVIFANYKRDGEVKTGSVE
jgi:dihydrofolate reductase